jgi:hypothetical protein
MGFTMAGGGMSILASASTKNEHRRQNSARSKKASFRVTRYDAVKKS